MATIKLNGQHYQIEEGASYEIFNDEIRMVSADGQESYSINSIEYKNSDEYKEISRRFDEETKELAKGFKGFLIS